MNKFRLILNKVARARFYVGLLFVGVIFLVAGIVVMNVKDTATLTATATITDIESSYDANTEEQIYTVYLEYTDQEGTVHDVTTNNYSSNWTIGKTITIKYDPSDYTKVSTPGTKVLPYILLAIGGVAIIFAAAEIVIVLRKKTDEENEFNKVDMSSVSQAQIDEVKNNDEPEREYYFYFTQGMKTSYIMDTNPGRTKVMEAQNQKLSFFTDYEFKFINHLTKKEEIKSCSHTVTTSYGSGNVEMTTNAVFKINGENCWKVLGKTGYSVEPHMNGVMVDFDVYKYGVKVGSFTHGGTNIMTGKNYKAGNIKTPGIYQISCRESDVEGVFLTCFIIARTYDF